MRIDYKNKNLINSGATHLHDAEFLGFSYDYENNFIQIEMIEYDSNKEFKLTFHNVFGFKMSSCDFWGKSLRVDCWYMDDENGLILELNQLKEEKRGKGADGVMLPAVSRMDEVEFPLQIKISIISGDLLTIVCEYVDFEERTLKKSNKSDFCS